jgi:hypothetical protein
MPGAAAKGNFAYSPIIRVATAAASAVATVTSCAGIPASERI